MKRLTIVLLLLGFTGTGWAVSPAQLNGRIGMLTAKFEAMQATPAERIPAKDLAEAQGIVLLDRTKAGLLFAYEGGSGVAMARDPRTGAWSAPIFVSANQASLGFLVGGQKTFMVILLMNTNEVHTLASSSYRFNGEATGTAGNASYGTRGVISSPAPSALVFRDTAGLYGGVAVEGGNISPDAPENIMYYGKYVSANDILFGHEVKPSPAAIRLARVIDQYSK